MAKDNNNKPRRKAIPIIAIVIGLLVIGYIHIQFWPRLLRRMDNSLQEGVVWSNMRLCLTMWDGVEGILYPHAVELMTLDTVITSDKDAHFTGDQLKPLLSLPGAYDAFYLNLEENRGIILNNTVPIDSLKLMLDKRGKESYSSGASRMIQMMVGGLNRIRSIQTEDKNNPFLVHYVGTYYPAFANEIVGVFIDESWYVSQVPVVLDSLYRDCRSLLFAAPILIDTSRKELTQKDIYAAPGGAWKQTIGVMYHQDTLWWEGDPKSDVFSDELDGNYRLWFDEMNLRIGAKAEFPTWREGVIKDFRRSTIFLIVIEALGIALIVILWLLSRALKKQASRNHIALSHLSHAVKTPVARIRLNVDTLLEDMVVSPDDEKAVLQTITGECERMELAVKGAAMSLQQGRNIVRRKSVDLLPTLTKAINAWDRSFESAGIYFVKDIRVASLRGSFDAGNIAVAVDNVLDNALRHTILNKSNLPDDAAKVAVTIEQNKGKAIIQIDDTGAGIPKSERGQIFERFQRVKDDAATGVSGLGLGLALVKEIAEAHGGNVTVGDSPLGGARFSITLPMD